MTDNRELATVPETDFSAITASQNSKAVFLPGNLGEAMQLAHFMAGGIGVRTWMRGNPSACLALIQISMRWGLDPYIVANKAYYTNDTIAFESQLVNAVINTSGQLVGRLSIEFAGDASDQVGKETLNCRVSGRLKADPEKVRVLDQPLCDIKTRNSPLWKVNPKLQLAYHATRSWARLYMPEVLLGIYTPDEIADGEAQRIEHQATPKSHVKPPDRRDFVEGTVEERPDNAEPGEQIADAEFSEVSTVLPVEEEENAAHDEPDGACAAVEDLGSSGPDGAAATGPELDQGDSQGGEAGEGVSDEVTRTWDETPEKDILDTVPAIAALWEAWRDAVREILDTVTTRKQFDALRRRIFAGLEAAKDPILSEVQDLLTDKLLTLSEEKK